MILTFLHECVVRVDGQALAGESGGLNSIGDVYAFGPVGVCLGGRRDGGNGGNGLGIHFERANREG